MILFQQYEIHVIKKEHNLKNHQKHGSLFLTKKKKKKKNILRSEVQTPVCGVTEQTSFHKELQQSASMQDRP